MTSRTVRFVPVLAGVIVTLLLTGVASAAWTSTGSGTAQAKAASALPLTITAGTASADLYPGGPAGSVVLTVTNPNAYPVSIAAITSGAVSSITSSAGSSCAGASTGLSYRWTTKSSGLGHVVAANGGSFTYTLTGALTMSNASDASCAGATFAVPVAVIGTSAAGSPASTPTTATVALP